MPVQHELTQNLGYGIGNAICAVCQESFGVDERMVNSNGQILHERCFVCVQCFQPFPEGLFYEYDERRYCEDDFQTLFAPCCKQCGKFVIGRVIKAMQANWHPDCFRCEICNDALADSGFVKNAGRALCKKCNADEKTKKTGRYVCRKCHTYIPEGQHIMYMGEPVHPWHYNCFSCNKELDHLCRKRDTELYCLRCHDKMGTPICGACSILCVPSVKSLFMVIVIMKGKAWLTVKLTTMRYSGIKKNLSIFPKLLFGDVCFVCNKAIVGDVVNALNKCWCVQHFTCIGCSISLNLRSKFHEFDMQPLCKKCYEKMPLELKKRLKKAEQTANRK
ncbi:LIM and senescent cell antigen-like-containing domain protein 1 [Acropora cervicornis]|uniref:LIM and senescent cell antigen-like-containing domain protein 1 n=1 Tax=Acropora cervicornis TaxID=6130 RepID=A0AAD9V6B2_ACRCE|nr:LIM and senescent cell antigen-like-containing domain protein 1 [Acropora cervicornis]